MSETAITPMLMFLGRAEEAVRFYTELFGDSHIEMIEHYGPDFPQCPPGQVVHARFAIAGKPMMAMDSAVPQPFSFTPAMSLFVECPSAEEVDRLYAALSEGGGALMPLGDYPFARRYAWVTDRFGVSWQLSFR